MTHLGDLELVPGQPVIAVSFTDADTAEDIAAARQAGVGMAELRLDLFERHDPAYVAAQVARLTGLPTLATLRLKAEGGAWGGREADRISVFETVLPMVDGVDIELRAREVLASIAPLAQVNGKLLVVSHHDFERTPPYDELAQIVHRALQAGADVVKIAAQVREDADIATLARLLEDRPAPNLVVIGMGDKGLPTRLMFPHDGSLFTFAAKGERASAPGQIAYAKMASLLGLRPGPAVTRS